jgi:hypothetical protein
MWPFFTFPLLPQVRQAGAPLLRTAEVTFRRHITALSMDLVLEYSIVFGF